MKFHLFFPAFFTLIFFASCQSGSTTNAEMQDSSSSTAKEQAKSTLKKLSKTAESLKGQSTLPAYGLDVSKFQGSEVDRLNKQKDSLSFIFCKATEGVTYTDPSFQRNWQSISQKGFIKGAYHFYRSADSPVEQANFFSKTIQSLSATDLPPVVDFEGGGIDKTISVKKTQTDLLTFLQKLESNLNRKPIIYVDPSTGNNYLNEPAFAKYALWVADYNNQAQPDLPMAWKDSKWTFWQKTSSYTINGEKNDFDVFNGNLEELKTFITTYQ